MTARIAFYAPLKPPDHPIASGDRETARNLVKALERCGYAVDMATRRIAYQKLPSEERAALIRATMDTEADRLIASYRVGEAMRPDLWFTYHPYCKAPDWVGPKVARALAIPYVTAEACRTRQGREDDWPLGRQATQDAVRLASVNFCLKPSDEAYLRSFLPDLGSVVALRPLLDIDEIDTAQPLPPVAASAAPLILAVGMMRPGAKMGSYRMLAEALSGMAGDAWSLAILGDGPGRPEVEALFAFTSRDRVHFAGAVDRKTVYGWMKRADLMAWPGVGEAFGVAYLEAAACGLAVAAFDTAGVPVVVEHSATGLLVPAFDVNAYRAVIGNLLASPLMRSALGSAARRRVVRLHGIDAATHIIKPAIDHGLELFKERS